MILRMEDPGVLQVAQDSLVRDFERERLPNHTADSCTACGERPWVKQFTHPASGRCNLELFSRGGGCKNERLGGSSLQGKAETGIYQSCTEKRNWKLLTSPGV